MGILNNNKIFWSLVAVVIIGAIILFFPMFGSNNNNNGEGMVVKDSGLIIEDIVAGSGDEAVGGKTITVHYTGTLEDGTKFDSSLDRGEPFQFVLGAGQVIQGWEEGINGMKVGGKRKLVIPPELGYGTRAVGSIPPNSTLLFDVELLDVD